MNPVRIIITGGTIDSAQPYSSSVKSTFPTGTNLPHMLEQSRVKSEVAVDLLMLKDSQDLTQEDRESMLERCKSCPERSIVITHGTDTMADTARFLGDKITDKTVVLVGAMQPYVMENSDSLFNLGYAISCAQNLPAGVYVAMNATAFVWNNVKKNRELGVFQALS